MSNKTRKPERLLKFSTRNRPAAIVLLILLSLLASWTMLAYSGAVDPMLRQKRAKTDVSIQSFNANSPSKEYVYAGGRLIATEEPAPTCGNPLQPPTNLLATVQSTVTDVVVTWSPVSGADHYEVDRKEGTLAWLPLGTKASGFHDTVSSSKCYLYRARAVDASGACPSGNSSIDLATTVAFTDPQLVNTSIKLQHLTELRQAVDIVRAAASLGGASWATNLDKVRATHFSELRTNLNDALTQLTVPLISSDSGIAANSRIFAVHLQAVRDKLR